MKRVFKNRSYRVLAIAVALVTFAVSVWAQNIGLLLKIIATEGSVGQKLTIFIELVLGVFSSMGVVSVVMAVGIAALFGINVALFIYVYKRRPVAEKSFFAATGGFITGLFSVGCASCGSFLLGSFLASIGAAGFIAYLPLRGIEFGIAAIVLLLLSVFSLARAVNRPPICEMV